MRLLSPMDLWRPSAIAWMLTHGLAAGCYASLSVDRHAREDSAVQDGAVDRDATLEAGADGDFADAADASSDDFAVAFDAGEEPDGSKFVDMGIHLPDAGTSEPPPFCFPRSVDAVRLEITTTSSLIVLEGTRLNRFYAEGRQWLEAGPARWLSSALLPCDPRLSHRGEVVLETAACSLGVSRLERTGAFNELDSTRARMTTDTADGGNVAIVSSVVYRHNGRSWLLELDLAATVANEGTLQSVAHEGEMGLLLGIGRSLFRTTAPLTEPALVLRFHDEVRSVAHDPGDSTTVVGTNAGTLHIVRSDVEVASFTVDGGVEEILRVMPETFLIRTRHSVYRFAGDELAPALSTTASDRIDDVALYANKAFAVVVRSEPANDCDRVRFMSL